MLKANNCAERRHFDQMNRRYKRQHQRTAQEKLHDLLQNDTTRDFWKKIGKLSLANERKSKIPMEVVDPEGHSIFDQDQVLEKRKTDYSNLLNSENSETFDEEHYETVLRQLRENSVTNNSGLNVDCLNTDITYQEVYDVVYRAKLLKAAGFDGIPSEVLRYGICIELLYKIISYCFKNGEVPAEWTKGIINPTPKSEAKDVRISLLSVPYKIYADILNQRLTKWLETNKLLVDEQNGFRKNQSCLEHIYSLYTIINNRKLSRKSTFLCFIDFHKAFDIIGISCGLNLCLLEYQEEY